MKKRPPLVPRKEEYQQDKTNDQIKYSNSFTAFAIICLLVTLIVSIAHEMYIWLK
jgi:hypothetical protein